jgi:hypothetical protein
VAVSDVPWYHEVQVVPCVPLGFEHFSWALMGLSTDTETERPPV